MGNYQSLLFDVIADRLKADTKLDRTALAAVQMPAETPLIKNFQKLLEDPPTLARSARGSNVPTYAWETKRAMKRDYISREAQNSSLGRAGEEFVFEYERWRLTSAGYDQLAEKVEHVSETRGDGLGFDVRSFDTNGKDRLIEVKTTSFGKGDTAFISKYEVDFSRSQSESFHLYRVFEFRKEPRLFSLKGPVDTHCHLDALIFEGKFS